jgi:hypothetical protein
MQSFGQSLRAENSCRVLLNLLNLSTGSAFCRTRSLCRTWSLECCPGSIMLHRLSTRSHDTSQISQNSTADGTRSESGILAVSKVSTFNLPFPSVSRGFISAATEISAKEGFVSGLRPTISGPQRSARALHQNVWQPCTLVNTLQAFISKFRSTIGILTFHSCHWLYCAYLCMFFLVFNVQHYQARTKLFC